MNKAQLIQEYTRHAHARGLSPQVLGDGSIDAKIVIIGEAPGAREVELRTPMVGPTGKYLWQALSRIGITRSQCYVTNVVKRKLAQSEDEEEKIGNGERDHWCELLRWELNQLSQCEYVILLGAAALYATTGHVGIEKWRGSCLRDDQGKWYVIANNPAHILRVPQLEAVFAMDIGKIPRVMAGTYVTPYIKARINPSYVEAMRWIEKMRDEDLPVGYDIETHGGETACVGLANKPDEGMCIAFRDRREQIYSVEEERHLRLSLSSLFHEPTIRIVAQNGIFDAGWQYYKDRILVPRIWHDTLLAHHCIYPTLPHDLGFLTAQYTDHPFYKDERMAWAEGGDIDQYWQYNVKDSCIILSVMTQEQQELRDAGLWDFFYGHVMRVQPHTVLMTANGVPVDLEMKEELNVRIGKDVERLRGEFLEAARHATGDPILECNPLSPKQLSNLLFQRLRLVSRGTSVASAQRERMLAHTGTSPEAKEVLLSIDRHAKAHKFWSTYVKTGIDPDGKYRAEFKQYGTVSAPGRLSSSSTLWGSGGNFQNQPPAARPMYVAPSGYEFFYFDLAQAEARVVAYEADIPTWKAQFERARLDGSYDCHRALASEMYRVPYDEVPMYDFTPEHKPTLRFVAKRCRHGLNYRMMWTKLAEVTGLSLIEANRIWLIYHRTTPELQVWWKELEHEARTNKMLFNAMGRRLLYLGPITEESMESIVAFKPQSLIGDKCTQVIYQAHEDARWPAHSRILINVHDSLTGIAPIGRGVDCLRVCKEYAERPITIRGEQLIIPADCALSEPDERGFHRWSNLKKMKASDLYGQAGGPSYQPVMLS